MNCAPLFDVDAYRRAGNCPWTFFAFPRLFADEAGLPPDADARRLLCALRSRGIPVGSWVDTFVADTAYFACPLEARGRLDEALSALEEEGAFEKGILCEADRVSVRAGDELREVDTAVTQRCKRAG